MRLEVTAALHLLVFRMGKPVYACPVMTHYSVPAPTLVQPYTYSYRSTPTNRPGTSRKHLSSSVRCADATGYVCGRDKMSCQTYAPHPIFAQTSFYQYWINERVLEFILSQFELYAVRRGMICWWDSDGRGRLKHPFTRCI